MTIGIIKCMVYAAAMTVLYGVLGYRNRGRSTVGSQKQSDTPYVVKAPSSLKYVYSTVFGLGIGLFFVFLALKVAENATVTMGHLYFSLVFAGIGLLVLLWASRWSVLVTGMNMEIQGLLHKKVQLSMQDIGKVKIGKKDALILYDKAGRKLVTIDELSENYDRLQKSLQASGKMP